MFRTSIMPLFLLMFITACTPSESEPMSSRTQTIAELMKALEQEGLFNGVVLVAEKGEVIYKGAHGFRRYSPHEPLKTDDAFEVGSISKPFTAVAIHMLAERGQLGYDDPLTKFFPKLPYESVTIGNLLSHTSGLFDVYDEIEMRKAFRAYYNKIDPPYTNKDYLAYLEKYRPDLIGKPLEKHQYSNTAYVLLALIVERVSGQRFDDFLREHIFDPVGMSRTGVYSLLEDKNVPYLVNGYRHDPLDGILHQSDTNPPPSMYGLTYGDDELFTTVDDLLAFDRALVSGKLLKPESHRRMMQAPTLTNGRTALYGQGFAVSNIGGVRYVSHTGSTTGFWAYFKSGATDNDHTVIVFTNVLTRRNTFRAVYTAINKIMRGQPYDMPRASIIYPLAEAIEKDGPGTVSEAFDRLNESGRYLVLIGHLNGLGTLYNQKGKTAEARAVYELSLRLDPGNASAKEAIGKLE